MLRKAKICRLSIKKTLNTWQLELYRGHFSLNLINNTCPMREKLLYILLLLLLCVRVACGQAKRHTVSGIISDENSGESLLYAHIYLADNIQTGTSSNDQGFYAITLSPGQYRMVFSYIGYENDTVEINLMKDLKLDHRMQSTTTLTEVEVVDRKLAKIQDDVQMSKVGIPMDQINSLPSFLGEVDILRSLQLMPGIQSAGELQSGILVRGGSRDQNLIMLDGVPIYNVSHAFGLFSVFNSDVMKSADVIKGGFPARYGGRLSSVLEMNMKDGHSSEYHGAGSIGLISSKFMLEGPINDRSSFIISARRTYWDLVFKPLINLSTDSDEKVNPRVFFYDVNAKINYRLNDNNQLFLSFYNGKDVLRIDYESESNFGGNNYMDRSSFGPEWGNTVTSLRLNTKLKPNMFTNTRLIYSRYNMDFIGEYYEKSNGAEEEFKIQYLTGIEDFGIRSSIDYALNPNHYLRMGLSSTYHTYRPGISSLSFQSDSESTLTETGSELHAWESNVYIEDEFKHNKLRGNIGLHLSHFASAGKNYFSLEPRMGLNYKINSLSSVKASYARMQQYINLLTSEALTLPSDFWVPSTDRLSPQLSHQWAIGYARQMPSGFDFSAEAFYKIMDNVVSYKEGVSFFTQGLSSSIDWQNQITQGNGEAYGLELLFQRKLGRLTGWVGYTLSWNWRQFEEINNGNRFPFRSDRRHDLAIALNYKISDRIKVSGSWIYQTGIAVSIPEGKYFDGLYQDEFYYSADKNNYRVSPTHRLDASIEFTKQKKRFERTWVFGVYNAYSRINPFFVTTNSRTENGVREETIIEAGILPIIPSISYRFKF